MTGEQYLQAIQLIFNGITALVNIILTAWVGMKVGSLRHVGNLNAQEIKSDIAINTAKTESMSKAVNGNLDARIATATAQALERGRLEGKAQAMEEERKRLADLAAAAIKKDESK
jgi:hypothetical protein